MYRLRLIEVVGINDIAQEKVQSKECWEDRTEPCNGPNFMSVVKNYFQEDTRL